MAPLMLLPLGLPSQCHVFNYIPITVKGAHRRLIKYIMINVRMYAPLTHTVVQICGTVHGTHGFNVGRPT